MKVRAGKTGIEPQRSVERCRGLFELPRGHQGDAEVMAQRRHARPKLDSPVEQRDSLSESPLLDLTDPLGGAAFGFFRLVGGYRGGFRRARGKSGQGRPCPRAGRASFREHGPRKLIAGLAPGSRSAAGGLRPGPPTVVAVSVGGLRPLCLVRDFDMAVHRLPRANALSRRALFIKALDRFDRRSRQAQRGGGYSTAQSRGGNSHDRTTAIARSSQFGGRLGSSPCCFGERRPRSTAREAPRAASVRN